MPSILALDSSTAACSVALWRDGGVAARRFEILGRGHAENLLPMIEMVMAEGGQVPEDLDLVAVTTGPGAFTGLRLGLATARGLAVALGIPCFGCTTMETMAAAVQAAAGEAIVTVLDSKRGDFYVQAFDAAGAALLAAAVATPDGLAAMLAEAVPERRCVLAGDVQEAAAGLLEAAGWRLRLSEARAPDAAVLAGLAARRFRSGPFSPGMPAPLYLRPADATPAKRGGRIRE